MRTLLVTHEDCFEHRPPAGHPESPARLTAVLTAARVSGINEERAPRADRGALERVHTPSLIGCILETLAEEARRSECARIDADTFMSAGSAEAALRAAGAVIHAVDRIVDGSYEAAFCAVRPPGHHAERNRPMGFCLFNNIAVGAAHARAVHAVNRIAVVDFDVHHGNGTQDIFFNDPNTFYASTHQMPLYPGTGFESEHGVAGNILNRALRSGSGSDEFRAVYRDSVLPALESFAPDFVFISAGFDAHRADPLAGLNLGEDDFAWVTGEICAIARRLCNGRVVSALEGGYDLDALAASAAAHVRALTEA
jgi:acetoin utilization deacetylase AcuC-like enzyme